MRACQNGKLDELIILELREGMTAMRSSILRLTTLSICLVVLLLPCRAFAQEPLAQPSIVRTVIVTVTDKNDAPLSALPASSLSITKKDVIQEIVDLKHSDTPISLAIVFDFSGSMGNPGDGKASQRTQSALAALAHFVQNSNPSNEYFLIGFNNKLHLLRDRFQDANATIADINSLNALSFINGAALYDAVQMALHKLSRTGFPKLALILVTDSFDTSSRATFKDTMRSLERSDALVYPIFLLPEDYSDLHGGSSLTEEARSILKDFASLSGGVYFQAKRSDELDVFLSRIASELRSQYFVIVALANNLEKKCHNFRLKLTSDNRHELKSLSLRTRKVLCVY